MESYGMLENMQQVPEKDQDLLKANSLQMAWAEEMSKNSGVAADPIEWMLEHAGWFRKEVIDNPDHHELIHQFEKDPAGTVVALQQLFQESEDAIKH